MNINVSYNNNIGSLTAIIPLRYKNVEYSQPIL